MANNQYLHEVKLETQRGSIYDRNLECLAINEPALSIGVDLRHIGNPGTAAKQLSSVLPMNEEKIYRQLLSGRTFTWLERDIEQQMADTIVAMKIPGIRALNETRRVYPYKHVAAQLIGFTNIDEKGLSGIELAFDKQLQGIPGSIIMQNDARGLRQPDVAYPVKQPTAGKNVITTINYIYQSIVEEELRQSINAYEADGGMVVMVNPNTGEILAMASEPGFDCNQARKYPPERWRNRAITDIFEPGSTFKIVIMSAVIEENLKRIDDIIDCENGTYRVLDQDIKDCAPYHELSVGDVLVNSSNIGMVKLSQQTDRRVTYKYAQRFGFGTPTGIDLGGEIGGELKNPVHWSDFTPAAIAMGYEVAVTPLQLAMAYSAIANGGRLLKPKIVLDIANGLPTASAPIQPQEIRRIISSQTATTIRGLLEQVVERGTGKKAKIDGVRICGKTGTAHKYEAKTRGYSENQYLSSFVGFFPADDPQILICTMLDNPRTTYWGSEVAAPTFKRIVQRLINADNKLAGKPKIESLTVPRNGNGKVVAQTVKLPDFHNSPAGETERILKKLGIDAEFKNNGDIIARQSPAPGTPLNDSTKVTFALCNLDHDSTGYRITPRLIGLSVRDAINRLTLSNLRAVVKGSGKVVRQSPNPGKQIKAGGACILECQPTIQIQAFKSW
ncbi:PASTA domain-containing protein [candidate division KSB1 bacterium]|nr:PASTA domain-containing protein [candidate division KSB1 bacterium]